MISKSLIWFAFDTLMLNIFYVNRHDNLTNWCNGCRL